MCEITKIFEYDIYYIMDNQLYQFIGYTIGENESDAIDRIKRYFCDEIVVTSIYERDAIITKHNVFKLDSNGKIV